MKLLYTGPAVNAELMVAMLEKHNIPGSQRLIEPMPPGEDEFSRPVQVLVPEADYEKAHRLFYADREDEL